MLRIFITATTVICAATTWVRCFGARALVVTMLMLAGGVQSPVRAQTERWADLADSLFTQLNPDQGLPTRFITAVAQDREGFIWIGTSAGLARWDGYHFKTYKSGINDPSALPSSYVVSLHMDAAGMLWVGTAGGGLARHEPGTERFTVFGVGANGVSDGQVRSMDDDGAGGLWIATDGGLDHVDAQGAWTHAHPDAGAETTSLPDNHVNSLIRDRKGRLWVGTRHGVARRDSPTSDFVVVPLPGDGGPQPEIWKVFEDSAGRIWIGATNRGVFVIEGKNVAHGRFPRAAAGRWTGKPSIRLPKPRRVRCGSAPSAKASSSSTRTHGRPGAFNMSRTDLRAWFMTMCVRSTAIKPAFSGLARRAV